MNKRVMKNIRYFALLLAFCASLVMCFADFAEAKRFGGSRSFGSSSSMNRSYSSPKQSTTTPSTSATNPSNSSAAQKQGTNTATPQKTGMFGGMGGMLGGILAGGLIGSLLFGGGMGGLGGGLLDIILLGAVAYFAYRFFMRRKQASSAQQATAGAHGGQGYQSYNNANNGAQSHSYDNAQSSGASGASGWDNLLSTPKAGPVEEPHGPEIPADFDTEDFLRGAKLVFTRLQQSWDRRDIDDVALFATPHVLEEIRNQAKADPEPSTTEVLLINANILEVKEDAGQQKAMVFFDVLLREDPKQEVPSSVREVWHFTRPADAHSSAMWLLDGIQQVEQ